MTKAMRFGMANSVIAFVICLSRTAKDICDDSLIAQAVYTIGRVVSAFWPNWLRTITRLE